MSVLQSCCNQLGGGGARSCLLHSSAEHLICSDEHDADDECNGEGTNQAFTHARVFFLLRRTRCGKICNNNNRKKSAHQGQVDVNLRIWKNLPPTVDVHVAVRTVQVALLRHDDVLDVFHGEVVAERVVKQPLQLVHGQFLHVALWEGGRKESLVRR